MLVGPKERMGERVLQPAKNKRNILRGNDTTKNVVVSPSRNRRAIDANGNTLSDASGKSYTWDFENRLTQAVVPGSNGGTTIFKYDPFGRRIQKSGPLGTTNYLYEGAMIVDEVDNSGNALAKYTQRGVDDPLAELRSGTTSYYEADNLGSISSLSSPTGALANTYTYDSFGELANSTGTIVNPFRYTGREFDPETGTYYYRARYYDEQIGRFTSEDPVGYTAGTNFYRYVRNRPTVFTDPWGTSEKGNQKVWRGIVTDTTTSAAFRELVEKMVVRPEIIEATNALETDHSDTRGIR
jgi:RHS repeat-associated protein